MLCRDTAGHSGCVLFSRSPLYGLAAWGFLFIVVVCCAVCPNSALSEPVPIWTVFAQESSDLPNNSVRALAPGADGALWIRTYGGGLARLDRDGQWRTYTRASTNGGLPNDNAQALASADGALWVGTGGGLARLDQHGQWQTYTRANTNGGLPNDNVQALASADGALWVGTGGGLARLDKHGQWQTYTRDNTNRGLPDNDVQALASADGSLWAGTRGGFSNFKAPLGQTVRVVDVIGISKTGEVTQKEQTVAAVAFDSSYVTQPWMFHYAWKLSEIGKFGPHPGPEIKTKSSVYKVPFDHDGAYQLSVVAIDRYGNRSDPRTINFEVDLPKPKPLWDRLAAAWQVILAGSFALYFLAFFALLLLTRWYAWAFRMLSDEVWVKWLTFPFLLLRNVPAVQRWVLEPWFQEVRRRTRTDIPFLDPPALASSGSLCESTTLLQQLRGERRIWLHGRSGMGKSSVFAAWERAYFAAKDAPSLGAATRRYGFILITLPVRRYATLQAPDVNRPESWVVEAVRSQLEQFGFGTRDLGLVEAMLRAGHIALALDGTNEADRDVALAVFARQFKQTRLLVTSQVLPPSDPWEKLEDQWKVWKLPEEINVLRLQLLKLWLGDEKGKILSDRIETEGLSATILSGYDLRLLADLAAADPEHAQLPADRIALYEEILDRARVPEGQQLDLDELAWKMMTDRQRRIRGEDAKELRDGPLKTLWQEGLRIIRPIGAEYEFRHDQMRAFLAARRLVQLPTLPTLQNAVIEKKAFNLNRRDQEELWRFVVPMLKSDENLEALWNFASDDPERGILQKVLQEEADKRNITLVRIAQQREPAMA